MKITRRRLLRSVAAASLPAAVPVAVEGMDDLGIVRMLVDAHKAAVHRWENDLSDEIWPEELELQDAISDELDRTAAALCFYRPTSIEGVNAKAEYMHGHGSAFFIEDEEFLTRADLIGGFLPPGKDVEPWSEGET